MTNPQSPHHIMPTRRKVKIYAGLAAAGMLLLSMVDNMHCNGSVQTYQMQEKARRDAAARERTIITFVPNNQ